MPFQSQLSINPNNVLCIVLGGGGGKGLYPLTRDRATAAVPLAAHYRLVDIPLSSCINSGIHQIYILTQFNSVSLHRHVAEAYKFDQFSHGFVEILAAQQTPSDSSWYRGTVDAVRKNLGHFFNRNFTHALIVSADQLYRFDFRKLLAHHEAAGADLTIAAVSVSRNRATRLGILGAGADGRVTHFREKPALGAEVDGLRLSSEVCRVHEIDPKLEPFLASMGIYLFNRDVLHEALQGTHLDFGQHLLPEIVKSHRVSTYLFREYWEDLGSIRSFFEANLELVSDIPRFNLFELHAPIYSQSLFLPGAKMNRVKLDHALVAGGCIIEDATISQSLIGLRSFVGAGSRLHKVICMGTDLFESDEMIDAHQTQGLPRIGIGRNTRIENAVIDRNARVGDNVVLSPAGKPENTDGDGYFIRDGIIIVPRNGVIPHGTVL